MTASIHRLTNPSAVRRGDELALLHAGWDRSDPPPTCFSDGLGPMLPCYALDDRDFHRRLEWVRLERLWSATWRRLQYDNDPETVSIAPAIRKLQARITGDFSVGFASQTTPAHPADLRNEALALRGAGRTLPLIAWDLDLCCSEVARDVVLEGLDTRLRAPAQDLRIALTEALDASQLRLWPGVVDLHPDLDALRGAVRIIRRRCRLLGLYPNPPRPTALRRRACSNPS